MTSNKLELSPAEQKVLKQKKARKAKDGQIHVEKVYMYSGRAAAGKELQGTSGIYLK